MYFRDPKKELPVPFASKDTEKVLIKTNLAERPYLTAYYVKDYWWDGKITVDGSRVLGWMPMSELDSIEIK